MQALGAVVNEDVAVGIGVDEGLPVVGTEHRISRQSEGAQVGTGFGIIGPTAQTVREVEAAVDADGELLIGGDHAGFEGETSDRGKGGIWIEAVNLPVAVIEHVEQAVCFVGHKTGGRSIYAG